jgi:hypothetical protein
MARPAQEKATQWKEGELPGIEDILGELRKRIMRFWLQKFRDYSPNERIPSAEKGKAARHRERVYSPKIPSLRRKMCSTFSRESQI